MPVKLPLSQGDKGDDVLHLQRCLNRIISAWPGLAASRLEEDGMFGPATKRAVTSFQQFFVLTPNGMVDSATWERLIYECRAAGGLKQPSVYPGYLLYFGTYDNNVRKLQQCINGIIAAKYPTLPKLAEDGDFGKMTKYAVLMFQRLFGLEQDGIVGPATWNRLMSECGI